MSYKKQFFMSSFSVKIFFPSTRAAYIEMCPIKWPTVTLNTALSSSWKKTTNWILEFVSKLLVNFFYYTAAKLRNRVTVCWSS